VEPEPRQYITKAGITFSVGDLKGLLTGLHDQNVYEGWLGDRYDGPQDNPFDPAPHDFQNFIAIWIRGSGRAVVMDENPKEQVWSYPVWKYEANMWAYPREKEKVDVQCILYYVDFAGADYVMQMPPETDPHVRHKTLYYWLRYQSNKAIDGRWQHSVADLDISHGKRNPDFMWVPTIPRSSTPCQTSLSPTIVDDILSP